MNEFNFYLILSVLLLCLASSSLIGFLNYKRLPFSFKVLTIYTLISFILELMVVVLAKNGTNNFFAMHLFTLLELLLFGLFFRPLFTMPALFVKYYDWIVGFFVLYVIGSAIFIQGIHLMNVYSETVENIVLIVFSILYFCNLYLKDDDQSDDPYRNPVVWVNSGLLLYLSGSLFIFMFGEFIIEYSVSSQWIVWLINVSLNLIFKILVLLAIIKVVRLTKKNSLENPNSLD